MLSLASGCQLAETNMTQHMPTADDLRRATQILRRGGVIALPTDTQYALSGIATDDDAIAEIFRLKQRPAGENLPVFLPPARWREHLQQIAEPLDTRVLALAQAAWPGALTLILNRRPDWRSRAVNGGTVALRIPDHPTALKLLDIVGQPLTGTSANLHGQPAALSPDDIRQQLGNTVHIVPTGTLAPAGAPSTILECTGRTPRVLRLGAQLAPKVGELLMQHWGLSEPDTVS